MHAHRFFTGSSGCGYKSFKDVGRVPRASGPAFLLGVADGLVGSSCLPALVARHPELYQSVVSGGCVLEPAQTHGALGWSDSCGMRKNVDSRPHHTHMGRPLPVQYNLHLCIFFIGCPPRGYAHTWCGAGRRRSDLPPCRQPGGAASGG